MKCYICPRKCGADRTTKKGFCGCLDIISIKKAFPHFWEEPCISGKNGSGAVFFEGCQLHCIFCQNHLISENTHSHDNKQDNFDDEKVIDIFFSLKEKGVHNINLVTPDMYIPSLIPIIKNAKAKGINLPFIMNCSGYETEQMINSLNGIIDIYLPDFKYMSPLLSKKYSNASDYSSVAKKAIDTMIKQQPKCIFDKNGLLKKGVIVRHMLLPGNLYDSKKILSYLYGEYGDSIFISIMSQYTPTKIHEHKELNKKVSSDEYNELVDFALSIGIKNSYIQEKEAADETFIPDFSEKSIL